MEAHRHLRQRVNEVLRRPSLFGRDESAEQLVLEAMAAVDGTLPRWQAELRGRTGSARAAHHGILPANALRNAAASVYAEIAHRCGWLDLDRALTRAEHQRLTAEVTLWVTVDRTLAQLQATFGPPSVWIGSTNPFYPKALVYATADPADPVITFYLWNAFAHRAPGETRRGVHPEPVVLAVRHGPGDFTFTPEGRLRRAPAARTVWIFHGARARHASAVFDTADDGLAWAATHRVSGILAEYPFGGTYDNAVDAGRFTPSKPHHGTPDHIASFGPGGDHIHLTDGHRE